MLTRRFFSLEESPAVAVFLQGALLSYRFSDIVGVLLEFQHLSPTRAAEGQLGTSKKLRAWRGLCLSAHTGSFGLTDNEGPRMLGVVKTAASLG